MDELFFKRLQATYKIEAQEHLQVMSQGIDSYYETTSSEAEKSEMIETVFRATHSLKGASRAVNNYEVEILCKNMEHIFSKIKRGDLEIFAELFHLLHKAIDSIGSSLNNEDESEKDSFINEIVGLTSKLTMTAVEALKTQDEENVIEASKPEIKPIDKIRNDPKYRELIQEDVVPKIEPSVKKTVLKASEKSTAGTEIIKISASKFDALFLQSEQMLSAKLASEQTARELAEIQRKFEQWKREWNKAHISYRKIKGRSEKKKWPELNRTVNFIEWNTEFILQINEKIKNITKFVLQNNYVFGGMVNDLSDSVKEALILPFSNLADLFPKLVRELARDLDKDISLEIIGSEIQADRRILEEMKDPLIHLIRNSVDHGFEVFKESRGLPKPAKGKIVLSISKLEDKKIEISIKDNGQGIDTERIKKAAVSKKIISDNEAEKLTEREALMLIFNSGLSTSEVITDISGYGLGLAIVKERVEKLGGSINVETAPGRGTNFRIVLPSMLATFRGIVTSCSGRLFVVPVANVEQVLRIKLSAVKTVENKDTILFNNAPVALVYLSEMLGLHKKKYRREDLFLNVIVLFSSGKIVACAVDEIYYEQEVLVKPFNRFIARLRNISAVTVLGDGKVVPILNVPDLIKSAERVSRSATFGIKTDEQQSEVLPQNILVIDDSITSRILLKDILESSGYIVKTAMDGVEALAVLKTEQFNLVVSDIEMPRMNGFELTRNIRRDRKYSGIPVILVTALSKKEDIEKGIDAGANAYIVKNNFEQSNLIAAVQRLI
ncbi:MAG: response regulator [Ignavibacteria bacterium]